MKSGVLKVERDHRDYSYPRTFGAATVFPDNLMLEWSGQFPDQEADGLPQGCTGYATAEICQDEDFILYDPSFTYDKTRQIAGTYPNPVPCAIRDALASTIDFGVKPVGESDEEAGFHRRGAYFNVVDSPDLDAFDDVRSALLTNKRSISAATPWYPEWGNPVAGILQFPMNKPVAYHNWKICGWKQINGQPFLIGKAWQGRNFGDHGYHYVSRETFNYLVSQSGTGCFTVRKALPSDILTIRLSMLQLALSYSLRLLQKLWPGS